MTPSEFEPENPQSEPAFNLPSVVVWLAGIMIALYVLQAYVLPQDWSDWILLYFAFWPIRFVSDPNVSGMLPGGLGAKVWSFVTYGFLHGGTAHLIFNMVWMAIFGSAVARRFGAIRFLVLSAACAAGGAALHLYTHAGEAVPMIGASAAISGQMAAAVRFVFELGGPLGVIRLPDEHAYRVPAVPLLKSFANRQVAGFMLAWFGLNLLFGFISTPFTGDGATIAWQAHIGGFLVGLALFPLLDPVPLRKN